MDITPEELNAKLDELIKGASETTKEKGTTEMPKDTSRARALMKWRDEHKGKDGKVVIQRRPPEVLLAELKRKREFFAQRIEAIDKKIRYYDARLNADKRKKLLAMISTEQLEDIVKKLGV